MKARYGDMTERDRAHYLARYPDCRVCGHIARVVDHDHETDLVRGALCHGCNSRIGTLEAALRLPTRCFQSLANDLHHAVARGQRDQLRCLLGRVGEADLAYLGMTVTEYEQRLRAVSAQLSRRFVYWTPIEQTLGGDGKATWSKRGPLSDTEQQRQADRLASGAHAPEHLKIMLTWEPDDGIDSEVPRGSVSGRRTPGAIEFFQQLHQATNGERLQQAHAAHKAKDEAYVRLVVPILLSRPLSAEQIQAAGTWGMGAGSAPTSPSELRAEISHGYQPRWVDLAVRIVLEDLGDDLPDARWSTFTRARWHWQALCEHWHARRHPGSSA
jgi:hypothetical protein